ncbi:MAG: DUF4238 domain-containing protein [Cytophagales bacterium]|nr:DUF4238 domain-containing protein [Cytophagales bacterium]
MSIPKRHHYVPRVHIRKFKSNEGYYLLMKQAGIIKNPKSSNHFFVKKELNTIADSEGNKDHKTFEKELADKWDNKFNYYEVI